MEREPTSDQDEQLEAVRLGLLTYEATHCKHGTFTGHWAGPDYLCGQWEMGDEPEEESAMDEVPFRKPVFVLALTIAEGDFDPDRPVAKPRYQTRVANLPDPHPDPGHGWACIPAEVAAMGLEMAADLLNVTPEDIFRHQVDIERSDA